jgi:hypothetical protein
MAIYVSNERCIYECTYHCTVQDLLWELKEMKKCNKSIGSVVQVQEANNGGRARGSSCKQEGRQE